MIYGIDADRLTVWIEPFAGEVAYRAGVLCRRHADAMVVPLGWTLDDRREAVPRLFKPREAPSPPKAKPKRQRHHAARDETGQLELSPEVVAAADADPAPPPMRRRAGEAGVGEAWRPVFDQDDDLDGLLTAESPLLSRAFGKRERPRRP